MTLVRLTLLAWVALLCLIGPARAQGARISLQLLCPKATAIAPLVEAAAATWRIRPVVLVAVMRVESGCRVDAVNKRTGARGLMQVLPGGSANADGLTRSELMDPATNLEWTRLSRSLGDRYDPDARALTEWDDELVLPVKVNRFSRR